MLDTGEPMTSANKNQDTSSYDAFQKQQMQWNYEGKKLDAAVKHLSWCPPWVRSEATNEMAAGFILEEHRVGDLIGLGRIPTAWWTLNCECNDAYDIHRLNVRSPLGRRAVDPHQARCPGLSWAADADVRLQ